MKRCFICCLANKIYGYLLWRHYNFDRWHASAPWYCRPYKKQVIQLASTLQSEMVIEIGCGLGEIISRIDSKNRFGYDIDNNAIKAARYLYSKKVNFEVASLSNTDKIISHVRKQVDEVGGGIIMINWLHNIQFDEIFSSIDEIRKQLHIKYLIVDEIKQGVIGYRFNHTTDQWTKLGTIISTVAAVDGIRNLHLLNISLEG